MLRATKKKKGKERKEEKKNVKCKIVARSRTYVRVVRPRSFPRF